jgi:hypothetical protein
MSQIKEDGHTDVASAVRQCKTAIEDASEMLSKLQGMNPEGDLPSWWMNKIAIAANSMNKLRDYLLVPSTTTESNIDVDNVKKDDTSKEKELKIKLDKEKDNDKLERQIVILQNQIGLLKNRLENERNKTVKPEPNPLTGEVPLRTGIAQALLDKDTPVPDIKKKKKEMKVGGKTKVDVDPDVDVGQYSDGTKVPTSNLG